MIDSSIACLTDSTLANRLESDPFPSPTVYDLRICQLLRDLNVLMRVSCSPHKDSIYKIDRQPRKESLTYSAFCPVLTTEITVYREDLYKDVVDKVKRI